MNLRLLAADPELQTILRRVFELYSEMCFGRNNRIAVSARDPPAPSVVNGRGRKSV